MNSDLLTTSEVAALLRVNVQTIRRWCSDGTLPATRVGKSQYRVSRAAVEELLRPRRSTPMVVK